MLMDLKTPRDASQPAIDAEVLRKLQELDPGGQSGIVHRVLMTYRKSLLDTLQALEPALRQDDPDAVRRLAHTLKSASASVGAIELSRLCLQLESAARGPDRTVMADLVRLLALEAHRVLVALPPDEALPD